MHVTATASKQRENDGIYSSSRHAASKQALHIHRVHTQPIVPFYKRNVTNNELVIPLKKGNLQDIAGLLLSIATIGRPHAERESGRAGFVHKQCSYYSSKCATLTSMTRRRKVDFEYRKAGGGQKVPVARPGAGALS